MDIVNHRAMAALFLAIKRSKHEVFSSIVAREPRFGIGVGFRLSASAKAVYTTWMIPQNELFQCAVRSHQDGNLPQAENLYRQVLKAEPGHVEAHHMLGI